MNSFEYENDDERIKPIRFTEHAESRMLRYGISEEDVVECIMKPDEVLSGYRGRKIAHEYMDRHMLRVVYEEDDLITVITVYLAKRERYGRRG